MTKKKIIIISIFILIIIIAIISNFTSNSLDYKDYCILGDSIMAGYGNEDRAFEYYFSKKLPNSVINNYAVPTSAISFNLDNPELIIANQIDKIEHEPDIILFDGGANDIMGFYMGYFPADKKKTIGEVDTTTKDITNGDSIISDLEKTISKMKTKFPNSKLCYLQMFLFDDDTVNHVTLDGRLRPILAERRNEFLNQIKSTCEKWGVDYIDVSSKFISTGPKYRQDDYVHIKDVGYKYITPFVLEELDKIY